MPRVERTTEMKWIQVFSRRGAELDLVRSWYPVSIELRGMLRRKVIEILLTLTSTLDMLPTTL